MEGKCLESVTVVANAGNASFRLPDGSVVDVAQEVLSRSSLLLQTLTENEDMTTFHRLETPRGFLRSWLQWLRDEADLQSPDALQLVQYLLV